MRKPALIITMGAVGLLSIAGLVTIAVSGILEPAQTDSDRAAVTESEGPAYDDGGKNLDPLNPVRKEEMVKYTVQNATERNAVCNDGTPAVYFYRPGAGDDADKWVVWFEGGGACSTLEGCDQRFEEQHYLMSSSNSDEKSIKDGILSTDQERNPDFSNWNHLMLNYCSSDGWTGDAIQKSAERSYIFAGHDIVTAIFEDFRDHSVFANDLSDASELLVSGSSAGGGGASQNLNRIVSWFPELEIKGVIDSSWDPLAPTYLPMALNTQTVTDFRNAQVDEACLTGHPENPALCSDLDELYPFWKVPVFIYIDQIDKLKLENAGITNPNDPDQSEWMLDHASLIRDSLSDVAAYFSPAYGQHTALTNSWFNRSNIDGVRFQKALGDWYFEKTNDHTHLFEFTGVTQN